MGRKKGTKRKAPANLVPVQRDRQTRSQSRAYEQLLSQGSEQTASVASSSLTSHTMSQSTEAHGENTNNSMATSVSPTVPAPAAPVGGSTNHANGLISTGIVQNSLASNLLQGQGNTINTVTVPAVSVTGMSNSTAARTPTIGSAGLQNGELNIPVPNFNQQQVHQNGCPMNMPSLPSLLCASTGINTMNNINSHDSSSSCNIDQLSMPNQVSSICSPISFGLPHTLKGKIVNGDYVDFAQLLDNEVKGGEPFDMKLTVDDKGSIVWKSCKPKHQITTIHSWTSAFLVYSSVFLEGHPNRVQELLKYAHVIRTAASRFDGWGWRTYDIQFRMRQQQHPQRSWALLDGELWAMYIAAPQQRGFSAQQKSFSPRFPQSGGAHSLFRSPFQKGTSIYQQKWKEAAAQKVCFQFNKSGCSRSKCIFNHKCITCQSTSHGAQSCKKGRKGGAE